MKQITFPVRGMLLLLLAVCFGMHGTVLAQESSARLEQMQNVLRYDEIVRSTDTIKEEAPLASLYGRIWTDVVSFPRDQTQREFQRKYGVPAPTFGSAIMEDFTLSPRSGARQAVDKRLMEIDEERLFARNLRFIQPYVIGKYLSVFMNGDAADSAFDLFLDIDAVHSLLAVEGVAYQDFLPPRFSAGLTNVARYLKGTVAQATQIDPNLRRVRAQELLAANTVTFREEGIPVCTLPGVVQEGDIQGLDEATKQAIAGRLVDLEEANTSASAALRGDQLLNRPAEKSLFERFLSGERVALPNLSGCFDTYCARLDFILTPPRPAPGRLVRPLPITVSLRSMEDQARTLANTPLETKYVGRSMFSYSFFQLDFNSQIYNVGTQIEIRFVPIFQPYDRGKSFDAQAFDHLMRTYTFLQQGSLVRTETGVVGADRTATNQVLSDASSREKTAEAMRMHKFTMLSRTILYWNQSYLKIVGDRLGQLQLQVAAGGKLFGELSKEMARLEKAKTVYSR